jgi:hypothetical protein
MAARLETLFPGAWEGLEVLGGGVLDCGKVCCLEDVVAVDAAEPLSSIDGSIGGGPSSAQRLDSYLDRMKDSNLLWRE